MNENPNFTRNLLIFIPIWLLALGFTAYLRLKTPLTGSASSVHQAGPVLEKKKIPPPKEPKLAESIRQGELIFNQTPKYAKEYVGNILSCTQCHLSGGRQEGILGLVNVASQYPDEDPRAGKKITLAERIQSCFLRSENGKAPPTGGEIIKNLEVYIESLTDPDKTSTPWRNFETISEKNLIPIARLNPKEGHALYEKHCSECHGSEGKPLNGIPPLWGNDSFNDGAGLSRIYMLGSFVRDAMPLGAAGSLNDSEAQAIAAYIDAQTRPSFAGKEKDYPHSDVPVDAVYYPQRYPQNPLAAKLKE
ncbi:MAG: c-type cytochrome [bacterium]